MKRVLITGVAGFIGSYVALKFLKEGYEVIGIDNLNDYYDPRLKEYRLSWLKNYEKFTFFRADVEDASDVKSLFEMYEIDGVINLAARAGVRSSLETPQAYLKTNSLGTLNLLEACKKFNVKKFILASTSSLYAGKPLPFKESLCVNEPISPYAATKAAAEAMAYTYHYLYGIDVFVLRYFTVYGPAGRPDMAPFRFAKWIIEETPITIFGDGNQERDFTYVEDIAEGTFLAYKKVKGYEIINLGGNVPHKLIKIVQLIEKFSGKKAKIIKKPSFKADMRKTWADITKAQRILGWEPKIDLNEGIKKLVDWHLKEAEFVRSIRV